MQRCYRARAGRGGGRVISRGQGPQCLSADERETGLYRADGVMKRYGNRDLLVSADSGLIEPGALDTIRAQLEYNSGCIQLHPDEVWHHGVRDGHVRVKTRRRRG